MVQSHRLKSSAKGCPYCYGKKPTKENNLWDSQPEAGKLWDAKRNMPTRPWEITPYSRKVFGWRCKEGHTWQAEVANVVVAICAGREPCNQCKLKLKTAR